MQQAVIDANRILSNAQKGFATAVTFSIPDGLTVTVNALAIRHHMSLNSDGMAANALNARVTVSEKTLTDLGYPTRNIQGDVSMVGNIVSFADSTQVTKMYSIESTWPDDSLGVIVCTLSEYEDLP